MRRHAEDIRRRRRRARWAFVALALLVAIVGLRPIAERTASRRARHAGVRALLTSAPGTFRPNVDPAHRLALIPELGPALAARAVLFRDRVRPIAGVDDLSLLPGVSIIRAQAIAPDMDFEAR